MGLSRLECNESSLIFYTIKLGIYSAAMIGMIWAVAFDWADGLIARRMQGRTGNDSMFGSQLDVLIDIVSYGVTPAILLLSYGKFDAVFLFGSFLMIAGAAIRLSYFTTFGLTGGSKYTGLALDNNNIILVFLFLFEGLLTKSTFTIVLYACCLGLTALNLSQIKMPKLNINPINVWILTAYTLVVTALYGYKLL